MKAERQNILFRGLLLIFFVWLGLTAASASTPHRVIKSLQISQFDVWQDVADHAGQSDFLPPIIGIQPVQYLATNSIDWLQHQERLIRLTLRHWHQVFLSLKSSIQFSNNSPILLSREGMGLNR